MSYFNFIKLISTIILFDISLCMVVFPFNTTKEKRNGKINENSEKYNSTHFLNDYFTRFNYIPMKIGSPPQNVNVFLTFQECGFKIGSSYNCEKYPTNYLSYYNRNLSKHFEFTDYYPISEFDSAAETIYAYDNLQLKNIKEFSHIGFYSGNNKNENFCGIIGLGQNLHSECYRINDIIKSFKYNNITSNYKWMIKYNTLDEGLFIIGANMNEIIQNYIDKNMYTFLIFLNGMNFVWGLPLKNIICGDNITINTKEYRIELDIDFSLIKGDNTYYEYIEKNFFQKYYLKGICSKHLWNYNKYKSYYIIECEKRKFRSDDIDKFPTLSFNIESELFLKFEGKDLFTETKYKYFFNVVFMNDQGILLDINKWIFGKIFLKKFPIIMDSDYRTISIYNNYTREVQK